VGGKQREACPSSASAAAEFVRLNTTSLDDGSRGLAAIHKAGGLSMVLTPAGPPERGMPENAIKFDGPISLIGSSKEIAEAICAACWSQPGTPLRAKD
jgi:hypothetical protein